MTALPLMAQTDSATGVQTIPDTLLFKIQRAQALITEINALNKRGFGSTKARTCLIEVKANVDLIGADMQVPDKVWDNKVLTNYTLILDDAQEKLTGWRTTLAKSTNDLQRSLNEIVALSSDSLLIISANDSSAKKFYSDQLTELRLQLQDVGTTTSTKLDTVSQVLADVSATYLTVSNLQTIINDQLRRTNANALQKESPYLWDAPATTSQDNMQDIVRSTYLGQNKILKYFIASTWDNRVLLLLVSIGFFFWAFANYRKAAKPPLKQQIGELNFTYLKPLPIVASLIVLLNLTPLFEPSSPSLYIELTQFLLLICLTVYLWKRLPRPDLNLWLANVVLYVLLVASNALVNDSLLLRLWLIILNGCFLYLGSIFYKKLQHIKMGERYLRPVNVLFLLLQALAIVLNIFGRISLAKTFSITAVIGLTQMIGLAVFIQIVLEAFELQIKVSSCTGGLFSRVNVVHTRRTIKRLFSLLAIVLWGMVFFINLGIASAAFDFFYGILTRTRSFGSVSFSLGNILGFFLILYIASSLQRNVGLLFGESQLITAGHQTVQKSSKLSLLRLIIVVTGFLLAIMASGITLTRLTIVLGALTVGIGLGMQMIVSNFVSGIILLFEKPFQIGDYVEIGDKKGKIQDIGIRSSKMVTVVGSEVIIPNSDFLSNRLVNWTSNNDYLKSELTFKVSLDTDLEALTKIVKEEAARGEGVLKNLPADVLINSFGADNIELKASVWITNIYTEAAFKSQLLKRLLAQFKEKGIKVM